MPPTPQTEIDEQTGTGADPSKPKTPEVETVPLVRFREVTAQKNELSKTVKAQEARVAELEKAIAQGSGDAAALVEQAKAEAATLKAALVEQVAANTLRTALLGAGLNPERLDLAVKLARDSVEISGDAAAPVVNGVADAVANFKATTPEWFSGYKGTGHSAAPGSAPDETELQAAYKDAQQRGDSRAMFQIKSKMRGAAAK